MEAATDFSIGGFGDFRLKIAGRIFFERIVNGGHLIVKNLSRSRSEQVKFERFLWNKKVTVKGMLESSQQKVSALISELGVKHVALVQDSSEFNFDHRKDEIQGLGVIKNGIAKGTFSHPAIAIDADDGFVLGLTDCKFWSWDPNRKRRKSYSSSRVGPKEKESYRWIEAVTNSKNCLEPADLVTVISDRESEMYSLFHEIPDHKTHVLVRSTGVRKVTIAGASKCDQLKNMLKSVPFVSTRQIELPARSAIKSKKIEHRIHGKPQGRTARKTTLAAKYTKIQMQRPPTLIKSYPQTIQAYCVHVQEVDCPDDAEKISWTLLTTHEVKDDDTAWQIVDLYRKRWIIEILFRTCKRGGFNAEKIEALKADAILKLCFLALLATVKVLQLTFCRDGKIVRPASAVFSKTEIGILKKLNKALQGKTDLQKNPHQPNTLAWAHWILGRLGGWKGYGSEGPAGASTIKRGLDKMEQFLETYQLIEDVCIS